MKRLGRALLIFLQHTRWQPAPEWEEVDARALQQFLATSTGRKLVATMTTEVAAANERAAMSRGGAFECGWACGYRGLLAWFEALSGGGSAGESEGKGESDLAAEWEPGGR